MRERGLHVNAPMVYASFWILFSALFIFEVPGVVFWAPTLLFGAFIVYTLYKKLPLRLSFSAGVLLIFGVAFVYFTYDPEQSIYYQSYILLQMLFMYILGFNFFVSEEPFEKRFEKLKTYILIVSLFYIVYVCITYGFYLSDVENAPVADRKYWSVWYKGEVTKAATGFSASMMYAVGWGTFALFFEKKKWKRFLGVGLIIFCFVFNVITKTRLLVFFVPLILAAAFFAWLLICKKKTKLGIALLSACFVLLAGVLLIYHFCKDQLQIVFEGTVLDRFISLGFQSTRWGYLMNVIHDFSFGYMGGGIHSRTFGVPHNFWFYVYDFGGIVPFLIYCLFTAFLIFNFVRFLLKKNVGADIKLFVSIMMSTIFAEFMLEDLLYALPSYVLIAHFIFGVFSGISINDKKQ